MCFALTARSISRGHQEKELRSPWQRISLVLHTPVQQVKCSGSWQRFPTSGSRLSLSAGFYLTSECETESDACWQQTSPTVSLAAVWQLCAVDKAPLFFSPPPRGESSLLGWGGTEALSDGRASPDGGSRFFRQTWGFWDVGFSFSKLELL